MKRTHRILEGGNYYAVKGPTAWSICGWEILERLRQEGDGTMLLVDDVHQLHCVSSRETELETIPFSPDCDYFVLESAFENRARRLLETLKGLPKKYRAKSNGNGKWYVGGFPITDEHGYPTCVLLDAGLTVYKAELGYKCGVNILPCFYQVEQERLRHLINRVLPEFELKVVLHDLEGNHWEI